MSGSARSYSYAAFGLTIKSDIVLSDYLSGPEPVKYDIDIKKVEKALVPNVPKGYWDIEERESEIELFFEGVGSFSVKDGERIAYTPLSGAETVALYLSGLVMGALLHQRGYLVMHASAVITSSGNVFAFCGESGSGKSSTAGLLCQQGYGFIADDVIAVPCRNTSEIRIHQGRKHLRVNPDMLSLFNSFNELQYSDFEKKYLIDFSGQRTLSGVLRAIFILNDTTFSKNNNLELLNKANSVFELTKNSMPVRLLQRTCDHSQLEKCAWLARRVPVYRFGSSYAKAGNHSTRIDVIAKKIAQLDFKSNY